jgi:TolB-like protein/DNA-binding winged helix-turn-helix (wHTH) protein/tetratricopeptide (TPR) repeat protein
MKGNTNFTVGKWAVKPDRDQISCGNDHTSLRPQVMDLLLLFSKNAGEVISLEDISRSVWEGKVVTSSSVYGSLNELRQVLGDEAHNPEYIETIPKKGYRLIAPVNFSIENSDRAALELPQHSRTFLNSRSRGFSIAISLVTASLLVALLLGYDIPMGGGPRTKVPEASTRPPAHSIAVLPFVDMSPNSDQQYLADGIAEEILNELVRNEQLTVIGRTSSFSFKGQNSDIATIAKKLNVALVLEGSVRKFGERIRVTTQLIDTTDSSHLWSETYDRLLGNALNLESDIASSVAEALRIELVADSVTFTGDTKNAKAFERYLQGKFFFDRRSPGDVEKAGHYFQSALDEDPSFARAWIGMAGVYKLLMYEEIMDVKTGAALEEHAIKRALSLRPDLPDVQIRAAGYHSRHGNPAAARLHLQRATELGQNSALVLSILAGRAAFEGRWDDAVSLQRRAVALEPLGFVYRSNLAGYLFHAGHYAEAIVRKTEALELNPSDEEASRVFIAYALILQNKFEPALTQIQQLPEGEERDQGLAMVYSALGFEAEADAAIQRLANIPLTSTATRLAKIYAQQGDFDESFRWLRTARERAQADRQPKQMQAWLKNLKTCPFFRPLHSESRWNDVLA